MRKGQSHRMGVWPSRTASVLLALAVLAGCSEELEPPVAVISAPATAFVGDVVALDGSESYDPGGASLSYAWGFLAIPAGSQATLNSSTLINPSFTADVAGTYTVVLVVNNGDLFSSAVSASIEVQVCGGQHPVVAPIEADPDEPGVGDTVRLSAEVTDPDNEETCGLNQALSYLWTIRAKPTGSLTDFNDPRLPSPTVSVDVSGEYTFQLVVTDSTGLSSNVAESTLTVRVCGEADPVVQAIVADPLAPLAGDPVQLSAQITDPDNEAGCDAGQTFTYRWELVDLPTGSLARIVGATLPQPFLTTDLPGSYLVELVVTDSTGRASEPGPIEILASACGTRSPTVDDVVVAPAAPNTGDQVVLAVTVSDEDNGTTCDLEQALSVHSEIIGRPAGSLAVFAPAEGLGPVFTADLPGIYSIRVTVSDDTGLSGIRDLVVNVSPCGNNPPVATLTAAPATPVVDQTVILTAEVEDADLWDGTEGDTCRRDDSFTYEWEILSAPQGSLASIILPDAPHSGFVPDVAGTYLVECRVFDAAGHRNVVLGTEGDLTVTVNVGEDASPEVSISADWDDPLQLTPLTVEFGCESTEGEPPFSYLWTMGDGVTTTEQNPTYTYTVGGIYVATCTVTDSNGDTGLDAVTVEVVQDTTPQVLISADPLVGFADLEVSFFSYVTQGNGTLSYLWEFGDGEPTASVDNPTHTYYEPGTYQVVLTVTDEDGDVGTDTLTIAVGTDSTPLVVATVSPTQGLSPLAVQFFADVAGGDQPLIFSWDFDGTDPDPGASHPRNPLHSYTCGGQLDPCEFTATVLVTDVDGDTATASVETEVWPDLVLEVSADADPLLGLTPLMVAFECTVSGTDPGNEPLSFFWTFGDGGTSTLQYPTYTYRTGGEFTATCTVTDADGDWDLASVDIDVTLDSLPTVAIQATTLSGVAPLTVDLSSVVTGGNSPYQYSWSANGTISGGAAASRTFGSAGVYPVVLTVTDDDGDIATDGVQIAVGEDSQPVLVAWGIPEEGSSPLEVQFRAEVAGGNLPLEYLWEFDPTGSSPFQNSTHVYQCAPAETSCTYDTQVTVTDQDGDFVTATVETTVFPDFLVDAVVSPSTAAGIAPYTVAFTCSTVGTAPGNPPLSYFWDFGDGYTSTFQNPNHTYVYGGNPDAFFEATCTITDADGDHDSDIATITVTNDTAPQVALAASPVFGYSPLDVVFTYSVSSGNPAFSYNMDYGVGTPDTTVPIDLAFTYDDPGIYIATLTVTDVDGDVGSDSVIIEVSTNSPPVPDAGLDRCIGVIDEMVVLDGTGTVDPDDEIEPYWDELDITWSFLSKPAGSIASLSDTGFISPAFVPDLNGPYRFQLTVSDGLYTTSDTVLIEVSNVASDLAIVGSDQRHGVPGAVVNPSLTVQVLNDCRLLPASGLPGARITWSEENVTIIDSSIWTDSDGMASTDALFGTDALWGAVYANYGTMPGGVSMEADESAASMLNKTVRFTLHIICDENEDCASGYCNTALNECVGPWHVDASAEGLEDGTTWRDAFGNLQDALDAAADLPSTPADQTQMIWVKSGSYSPGPLPGDTFDLDQVVLHGGFDGYETNLEMRGCGGDPPPCVESPTYLEGNDTNYHVVRIDGAQFVTLDRFSITGGNAVGSEDPERRGGGIYISNSTDVSLTDLVIEQNVARDGGGMFIQASTNVTISSSEDLYEGVPRGLVADNVATRGGGIFIFGASPTFERIVFDSNMAPYGLSGGAFSIWDSFLGKSSPFINNCIFFENTASSGGAIVDWGGGAILILNNTFYHNYTTDMNNPGWDVYIQQIRTNPVLVNNLFDNLDYNSLTIPSASMGIYNRVECTTPCTQEYHCPLGTCDTGSGTCIYSDGNACQSCLYQNPDPTDPYQLVLDEADQSCIDMGTDQAPYYTEQDVLFNVRFDCENHPGDDVSPVDIGAFEAQYCGP